VATDETRSAETVGARGPEAGTRYRPAYPDQLLDDLAALRPVQVLDIATGTDTTAAALTRRGLAVHGVDVTAFAAWDDRGRRYELITCGDAWHRIDPAPGVLKAAILLRTGGTLARFWTHQILDRAVSAAFEAVYRTYAPQASTHGREPTDRDDAMFLASSAFTGHESRTYWDEHVLTAEEWVALVTAYPDHQRLGPQRLAALVSELRATIAALGGRVHTRRATVLVRARRT